MFRAGKGNVRSPKTGGWREKVYTASRDTQRARFVAGKGAPVPVQGREAGGGVRVSRPGGGGRCPG